MSAAVSWADLIFSSAETMLWIYLRMSSDICEIALDSDSTSFSVWMLGVSNTNSLGSLWFRLFSANLRALFSRARIGPVIL